ncbi:MAG: L,D-transpeptidase, partial [Chthoniobacterales bacterium]
MPKRIGVSFRRFAMLLFLFVVAVSDLLAAQQEEPLRATPETQILISIADQKLVVIQNGIVVKKFPVSTSKFGVGDSFGTYRTPTGQLRVCDKLGENLHPGAVIRHRNPTGEILKPNAPGRDPIVTRILWLEGMGSENLNARERGIYIHGTVDERHLGRPASYGCIRMRSSDVIEVFNASSVGTTVMIIK